MFLNCKSYDVDVFFFEVYTSGFKLVSCNVFGKLVPILGRTIFHKLGNNYPTLNQIIKNYNEVIRTLRNNKMPYLAYSEQGGNNKSGEKKSSDISNFCHQLQGITMKIL